MKSKLAATAHVAGLVLLFGVTFAHADNFYFAFDNTIGNVTGTVTGEIFGLVNNSTSAATDVIINSAPTALGLPSVPFDMFGTPNNNSFTETAGTITNFVFASTDPSGVFFLQLFTHNIFENAETSLLVESVNSINFSSVPSPIAGAGLPGMIPVFASVGLLGWWRRRQKSVGNGIGCPKNDTCAGGGCDGPPHRGA
jgi:hypothetical protein